MTTRAAVVMAVLVGCNNSTPAADVKPAASAATTPSASAAAPPPSGATSAAAPAPKRPVVTDTFATSAGDLTVTPIHHATMLLRTAGKAIYIDPASADASYEGLPKADYVFITDIHGDHMDPAGLAKVKKEDTVVVAPPSVNAKMPAAVVMKNGDTHDFGTFKVEAVPMYNLTRGPSAGQLFHDKGRGDGFVFTFGKTTRVYVSGDTECTPEMKALKSIDIAFVCMNLPYTMPPAEAAECVNAFKPKVVFPFHYRGSNVDDFAAAIKPGSGTEVRKRDWY